jgi:hypothetical protein
MSNWFTQGQKETKAGWTGKGDSGDGSWGSKMVAANPTGVTDLLGKGGEAPQMSAVEQALMGEQINALRAQQAVTANQFHYKIDDYGNWTKMSDSEWYAKAGDTEKKQWDLYQKELGRYDKALEGGLPLSQGMQVARDEEFQGFKNTSGITGGNLNTAKANDTIGVQRLDAMKKRWNLIQEQEQQQALGQSGNMVAQGQGLTGFGTGNPQMIGNTNAWNAVLDPYQQYNVANANFQQQQRQTQASNTGMAIGLISKFASSRKFKKNIILKTKEDEDKALNDILNTNSYSYQYKEEMGLGDDIQLGAIAEEVPEEITNKDRTAILLGNKLELMVMAFKAMARKVELLEAR